jgi:hypothetical protein
LYLAAAIWPAVLALAGLILSTGAFGTVASGMVRWLGWILVGVTVPTIVSLTLKAQRPLLAVSRTHLFIYVRSDAPVRVPLDAVEGFLLGQGPVFHRGNRRTTREVRTVVIRLAERNSEWAQLDVRPELASWCGHYVTIRGMWCEPLSIDLVNSLNQRLAESHRRLRHAQAQR